MLASAPVPTENRVISIYGWRYRRKRAPDYHTGIDIAAAEGSPVLAVHGGRARAYRSGELSGYGNVVVVDRGELAPGDPAPRFQLYAHLKETFIDGPRQVLAGEAIGTVGRTAGTRSNPGATVNRPHLHYEYLTRWPPEGKDLDRVDPSGPWAAIGIVAELGKPVQAARPVGGPLLPVAAAATGGAGLLLFLFLWGTGLKKKVVALGDHLRRFLPARKKPTWTAYNVHP